MVYMPEVSYEHCHCCGWTPDGHHPDDWQAFAPWNSHLLCLSCRRLAEEFQTEVEEEPENGIPVEVSEGVDDAAAIDLVIEVDNDGNIIAMRVTPHEGESTVNNPEEVVDLTDEEEEVSTP
jgi:hypothetical protein